MAKRRPWFVRGWPLRARLTAWYVLLLGLTLLLFGGYLFFRQERGLLAQTDAGLGAAAAQVLASLETTTGRPLLRRDGDGESTIRRLTDAGYAARLSAADGSRSDGFGPKVALAGTPAIPGYATLAVQGTDWRVYSRRVVAADGAPLGWLQVALPLTEAEEALDTLFAQMLLALPLVLLLAGLGGYLLADRALRPVARVTRAAAAIGADDLARRIAHVGPDDEVGRLAATFDGMLDRLEAAFARERRFTADAAHELRTPLAALKGQIGVALSRPRAPDEYAATLRDLDAQVDRLIRLSTDLLFLARLEGQAPQPAPETIDLSGLLEAIAEQLRALAEARGIALAEDIPPGVTLAGEFDHLIRLFLNLLDNAIKYTPPGGRVAIRARAAGRGVCVTISDSGPGIAPEHLPHLFERFYRAEAARDRPGGGAGLGLAMAQEITRRHGGTLTVESAPGRGTWTCLTYTDTR